MYLNSTRLQTLRTFVFISFVLSVLVISCTPDTYQYNDKVGEVPYGVTYSGVGDVLEGQGFETSKAYINTEVGQTVKYYISSLVKGDVDMGKPDFIVVDSITGSIVLKEPNDLLPGLYSIGILVKNFRNDFTMELHNDGSTTVTKNPIEVTQTIFKDGFIFEILSRQPADLDYIQKVQKATPGKKFTSTIPVIKGSQTITFALAEGTPSSFAIDENTGVITLAEGNSLEINKYALSIVATNGAGSITFNDVVTVIVAEEADLEIINSNFIPFNKIVYAKEKNDLGNMFSKSIDEPTSKVQPKQHSTNFKWSRCWGIWNQKIGSAKQSFAVLIPEKSQQDDYLLFNFDIRLTGSKKARVIIDATHNWGAFDGVKFDLVVSDKYTGDPATTVWKTYPIELDPVRLKMSKIEIPIPDFEGKENVRIGLHSVYTTPEGKDVTVLSKNLLVKSVSVKAIQ
ncbi:hypothetical protein OAT16_07185 [Prolixibacteraceae bacterium]|nr:hypothetical protein [Prolixibacteraceae bacterium]